MKLRPGALVYVAHRGELVSAAVVRSCGASFKWRSHYYDETRRRPTGYANYDDHGATWIVPHDATAIAAFDAAVRLMP